MGSEARNPSNEHIEGHRMLGAIADSATGHAILQGVSLAVILAVDSVVKKRPSTLGGFLLAGNRIFFRALSAIDAWFCHQIASLIQRQLPNSPELVAVISIGVDDLPKCPFSKWQAGSRASNASFGSFHSQGVAGYLLNDSTSATNGTVFPCDRKDIPQTKLLPDQFRVLPRKPLFHPAWLALKSVATPQVLTRQRGHGSACTNTLP